MLGTDAAARTSRSDSDNSRRFVRLKARELLHYGLARSLQQRPTWATALSDRYILAASQGLAFGRYLCGKRDLSDKGLTLLNTLFLLASTPVGVRVWNGWRICRRHYLVNLTRYYLLIVVPLALG